MHCRGDCGLGRGGGLGDLRGFPYHGGLRMLRRLRGLGSGGELGRLHLGLGLGHRCVGLPDLLLRLVHHLPARVHRGGDGRRAPDHLLRARGVAGVGLGGGRLVSDLVGVEGRRCGRSVHGSVHGGRGLVHVHDGGRHWGSRRVGLRGGLVHVQGGRGLESVQLGDLGRGNCGGLVGWHLVHVQGGRGLGRLRGGHHLVHIQGGWGHVRGKDGLHLVYVQRRRSLRGSRHLVLVQGRGRLGHRRRLGGGRGRAVLDRGGCGARHVEGRGRLGRGLGCRRGRDHLHVDMNGEDLLVPLDDGVLGHFDVAFLGWESLVHAVEGLHQVGSRSTLRHLRLGLVYRELMCNLLALNRLHCINSLAQCRDHPIRSPAKVRVSCSAVVGKGCLQLEIRVQDPLLRHEVALPQHDALREAVRGLGVLQQGVLGLLRQVRLLALHAASVRLALQDSLLQLGLLGQQARQGVFHVVQGRSVAGLLGGRHVAILQEGDHGLLHDPGRPKAIEPVRGVPALVHCSHRLLQQGNLLVDLIHVGPGLLGGQLAGKQGGGDARGTILRAFRLGSKLFIHGTVLVLQSIHLVLQDGNLGFSS
mmetsp:Transcript_87387/g.233984  ORF Transcript_87387/g.233984 Transcript_87387/m.233984 type:complete len:586 (-) Transcript_87387:378-2135(-)